MTQTAEDLTNVTTFPRPLFSIEANHSALSHLDLVRDDPDTPLEVDVDGRLLLLASRFTSTEKVLPALCCVLLLPYNDGALMVALDGHTMGMLHDENGKVSKPALVRLSPDLLKALKPTKKTKTRLCITPDLRACVRAGGVPTYIAPDDIRETKDTFPDFRQFAMRGYTLDFLRPVCVNNEAMVKCGLGTPGALILFPAIDNGPVFIRHSAVPEFLGMSMPMFGDGLQEMQNHPYPEWHPAYVPGTEGSLWADIAVVRRLVAKKVD